MQKGSIAEKQAQAETQQEKKKNQSRSPGIEIIYGESLVQQGVMERKKLGSRSASPSSAGSIDGNASSGSYRDITVGFFHRNPACLQRLPPWFKSDLTVLFGIHGSPIPVVQYYI